MELKERLLFVLLFLLLSIIFIARFLLPRMSVHNVSAVGTVDDIEVYWDENCTLKTTTIDWGVLRLGEVKEVVVYVRNEGDDQFLLALTPTNWNPNNASSCLHFSWSCRDNRIGVSEVEKVTLSLQAYPNITRSLDFSFDIIFYTQTGLGARALVRGLDNRIYYRMYDSSSDSWDSWNAVPTGTTCDSPAAVVYAGKLYMVVRGMDESTLWFSSVNLADDSFLGWTLLGGFIPSAPTLTSNGTTLALVVQGGDNRIYYRFYTIASQAWTGWLALPSGTTPSSPGAKLIGNRLYIVVRGMDGITLWYSNVDLTNQAFSGWTLLNGSTLSIPTLTGNSTTLTLVVRGGDDRIYYRFCNVASETWTSWLALPSGTTIDSTAATIFADTLCIVVRGSDGSSLWQSSVDLDTSTFSGWTLLSGSTPSKPTLTSQRALSNEN